MTSQRFVLRRMHGVFHQLARCCHFAGQCLKENELPPPFVGRSLFLYACIVPFYCQTPLGVFAYFNDSFFNSIEFFLNLFIHSLRVHAFPKSICLKVNVIALLEFEQWSYVNSQCNCRLRNKIEGEEAVILFFIISPAKD